MIVLSANPQQFENLNGYKNGFSILEFQEYEGLKIVSQNVLNEPDFFPVLSELEQLEKVEINIL